MKKGVFVFGTLLLLTIITIVASAKEKEKQVAGKMVDSGSFGIFQNGRRIGTENFSISTNEGLSTIDSRIEQAGASQASQTSDLQIASDGSLIQYEWHELQEPNAELTLQPNNEFLTEHITQGAGSKPAEQPFLMPKTSVILDDNFTVQREVFAWRYLASACQMEKTEFKCAPAQFGIIVPQERISMRIGATPIGMETILVRGTKRQLWRVDLKSDSEDWSLWLDPADHYKLIRLTRAGVDMEVVRD